MELEQEQALIPGLPEDLALECLCRVPHQFHSQIRPVSKIWRDHVTAPHFSRHRHRIGASEHLIFTVQSLTSSDPVTAGENKPENEQISRPPPIYALSLYNATLATWHRVAPPPDFSIPMFANCAAVGDQLVLIGGWDPSTLEPLADVRILDAATMTWRKGKPMTSARSFFACAAAGGRVFVAGGHDSQKNALRTAAAYDVASDEWVTLPDLNLERDEARGVVIGGKFWAVSGYSTENQGRFAKSAEFYDEDRGTWQKVEGVWDDATCVTAIFGRGGGGMVSVDHRGVREWSVELREWSLTHYKEHECLVEGPLNNLKQSMVQFQKPKKIYNERRLFYGAGPGAVPGDSFGPVNSSGTNSDKRGSRNRGHGYLPFGPPNGTRKPGVHPPSGYPLSRIPLPPFPGGPHSQPYAIPTRGAVHGPIGAIPQVPQPGSRGLGAGGPIGGHLPHQQSSQQAASNINSGINFPPLDNPNSQPSVGGPLSQTGLMTQVPMQGLSQTFPEGFSMGGMSQEFIGDDFKSQGSHVAYNVTDYSTQASQGGYGVDYVGPGRQAGFTGGYLNQNSQPGYSHLGAGSDFISQEYMAHGSQGLFTQAAFNGPSQDEPSQSHFGVTGAGPLQSQGLMNPLYSQLFPQYNSQPMNMQPPQQQNQSSPCQKNNYNG